MLRLIAFDADDTLWHNEKFYSQGKEQFKQRFAAYASAESLGKTLDQIEEHNVRYYGYGLKSFTLSLVETAVQVAGEELDPSMIKEILAIGKRMLQANPQHFEHAEQALSALGKTHDLMLVTKGDLFEQERKVRRSGLAGYFRYIEVVSDKTPEVYQALLKRYNLRPEEFLMVGNSLRSDILPVVEIGGRAVYIPYENTWAHENKLDRPLEAHEYDQLEHIGQMPAYIRGLTLE